MTPRRKAADTILHGFKRVSPSNLTEEDTKTPFPSRLRGEKWVRACLKPELESCVPQEVAFLFEVARGAMVYGMFFQPLASLAIEQCYRVLEAGARRRCLQLGLLPKKRSQDERFPNAPFSEILTALRKADKIPKADLEAWTGMPFLRNRSSHPASQTILSPDSALGFVAYTAELLNRLFR